MKKLATYLIILTWTIVITTTVKVFSKDIQDYNFGVVSIPVVCGQSSEVLNFLQNEGLDPTYLSLGKEGAEEKGRPVFLITEYESKDKKKKAATVQTPNSEDVCILYYTFDAMKAPPVKGI